MKATKALVTQRVSPFREPPPLSHYVTRCPPYLIIRSSRLYIVQDALVLLLMDYTYITSVIGGEWWVGAGKTTRKCI